MAVIKEDIRAAADLVRQAKLEKNMKDKCEGERQNSSKTKDTRREECEQMAREASPAAIKPKKGLWLGNMVPMPVEKNEASQSGGPVLAKPAPFLDYNEELTTSDLKVMERLGISRKTYGKLPRALVEQLKEAEAELSLFGGLKNFFRMAFADNVKTPQAGTADAGPKVVNVEKASDSDNPKRSIIVILVHPLVTDMHIVQDLARGMVDMIRNKKSGYIESFYQCEYMQKFCRPGSSKQEALTKVESTGNFRLINLEKYNRVARKELRNNWGRAQHWFPRHIPMNVSRKEVFDMVLEDTKAHNYFIITDRVASEPMDKNLMVQQYHENLMRRTDRNVMTVHINCDGGRYTHCVLRSDRLITNREKWAIKAEIERQERLKKKAAEEAEREEKAKNEKNGIESPGSSS